MFTSDIISEFPVPFGDDAYGESSFFLSSDVDVVVAASDASFGRLNGCDDDFRFLPKDVRWRI